MKDDRLRVPVEDSYISAIGRASYCFARLEWATVHCGEKVQPGYIATVSRKTAGQIASDIASAAFDDFIVPGDEPLDSVVRRATRGRGAEVVFDAVGGPMFEPSLKSLARRGRQTKITSVGDRRVSFDLLDFYHNGSRLFGVDTRQRDAVASAALLEALTPFFEQGALKAPMIDRVIPLSEGPAAYAQVARGEAKGRLVLAP